MICNPCHNLVKLLQQDKSVNESLLPLRQLSELRFLALCVRNYSPLCKLRDKDGKSEEKIGKWFHRSIIMHMR